MHMSPISDKSYALYFTDDTGRLFYLGVFALEEVHQCYGNGVKVRHEE